MKFRFPRAFTLIELLIVVAILAILAAIAVPNFLEAQTRSKISRARNDMRTLSLALESYAVDSNRYPPGIVYNGSRITPDCFTTPNAYLTSLPHDPFRSGAPEEPLMRYDYHNVKQMVEARAPTWPPNDLLRYGDWRFVSVGPEREYNPWLPYDASNGTISPGNLLRTQRSPEGRVLFTFWDPAHPEF